VLSRVSGNIPRMKIRLVGLTILGFALLRSVSAAPADEPPIFVGGVVSAHGETTLYLTDEITPLSVPPIFAGWACYIGDTQRKSGAYIKQITCGGPWGFVDAFVSCEPKHRQDHAIVRLRQPIDRSKQQIDAAEKLTITVGCGYGKK
jgi:hypothetical protein